MNNHDSTSEITNEQLVADTLASLRNDGQVDAVLLDILSKTIVKTDPARTAVDDAAKAIEALASKRAEEPK